MAKSQKEFVVPVILSGGVGTRLWPLSREAYPKQFHNLASESHSLIQQTAMRVSDRTRFAAPVVICNQEHRFLVAQKLREMGIDDATIILEPFGRNTAPAVALAAHYIKKQYGDALMLVLPSDHVIGDAQAFLQGVEKAERAAEKGYLVTFGITPTTPETGYGYIQRGDSLIEGESYHVSRFIEKPDVETARRYLDDGGYAWNSGMFLLDADSYLQELECYRPDMAKQMDGMAASLHHNPDFIRIDNALFAAVKGESIDYAVMEHTRKAAIVPMECGWTDIGSWDALWAIKEKDADGNAIHGDADILDVKDCYISCRDGVRIAALGVENLAIISTGDCILVADKERSQEVKQLVETVRAGNPQLIAQHRKAHRAWGHYDSIDSSPRHQVKRIVVNPAAKLSLPAQPHSVKQWIVISGTAIATYGDNVQTLTANQSAHIPCGTAHSLENAGDTPLELIEVQSGSFIGETEAADV